MIEFVAENLSIENRQEYRRASVTLKERRSPAADGRTYFSIVITGPAEGRDGPSQALLAEYERLARRMIREDVLEEWLATVTPNPQLPDPFQRWTEDEPKG